LAVSEVWFIDQCLDVLGRTGKLDADEVLEDFIPLGSDETEMGPVANRLVSPVARATQDVERRCKSPRPHRHRATPP